MSTGDMRNNLQKLLAELRGIKYEKDFDLERLSKGISSDFLPIYHYAFIDYSRHIANLISESGMELYGKSDLRFMEILYKVMRELFLYKPPMTKEQFFSNGFAERKIIMCADIVHLVKTRHKMLASKNVKSKSSNLTANSKRVVKEFLESGSCQGTLMEPCVCGESSQFEKSQKISRSKSEGFQTIATKSVEIARKTSQRVSPTTETEPPPVCASDYEPLNYVFRNENAKPNSSYPITPTDNAKGELRTLLSKVCQPTRFVEEGTQTGDLSSDPESKETNMAAKTTVQFRARYETETMDHTAMVDPPPHVNKVFENFHFKIKSIEDRLKEMEKTIPMSCTQAEAQRPEPGVLTQAQLSTLIGRITLLETKVSQLETLKQFKEPSTKFSVKTVKDHPLVQASLSENLQANGFLLKQSMEDDVERQITENPSLQNNGKLLVYAEDVGEESHARSFTGMEAIMNLPSSKLQQTQRITQMLRETEDMLDKKVEQSQAQEE